MSRSSQARVARRKMEQIEAFKFFRSEDQRYIAARSIRLGSAAGYREAEGEEGGLSDKKELVTDWEPGNAIINGNHPFVTALMGGPRPGATMITQPGTRLIVHHHAVMFCASLRINDEILSKMWSIFGYDKYYRISDLVMFGRGIYKNNKNLGEGELSRVSYDWTERQSEWSDNQFEKRANYSWQSEVRIVWRGHADKFIDVNSTYAFKHVSGIFHNPASLGL